MTQLEQAFRLFRLHEHLLNRELMEMMHLSGKAGMKVAARAAHSLSLVGLVIKNKRGDHTLSEKGRKWKGRVKPPKKLDFQVAAVIRRRGGPNQQTLF